MSELVGEKTGLHRAGQNIALTCSEEQLGLQEAILGVLILAAHQRHLLVVTQGEPGALLGHQHGAVPGPAEGLEHHAQLARAGGQLADTDHKDPYH